jgi:aryl-phospho-beta-D-glucosidase BglC (GH1 family)
MKGRSNSSLDIESFVNENSSLLTSPKHKNQNEYVIFRWKCGYLLFILFLSVIIFILLDTALFENKTTHDSIIFNNNQLIYIRSKDTGLYLLNDIESNNVLLRHNIPWIQGSSYKIESISKSCFYLKSSYNNYISIDKVDNILITNKNIIDATPLEFVTSRKDSINDNENELIFNVRIKECSTDIWLIENNSKLKTMEGIIKTSIFNEIDNTLLSTLFEVEPIKQINGVNLGGWFIPEVWMNPGFYNDTGLGWGGSLCTLVKYSRSIAEERIIYNLNNWITETDFMKISQAGFNSIRLPIGYWNIIEDPYSLYAPNNLSLSLKYIDFAFEMVEKYNLTILIDLHGGPGSQNGIDHSGCSRPATWEKKENINLSLISINAIVNRYSNRTCLIGIELLNEPSQYYSGNFHETLLNYYKDAYEIIRKYSSTIMVIFNELYPLEYNWWNKELKEPNYYNVIFDMHLYEWPHAQSNISQHLLEAKSWEKVINSHSIYHPIIIGEWCMSTGINQVGQPFVDTCINSFHNSKGWYLWNWKITKDLGFDEWDVQLQYDLDDGLNPFSIK